MAKTFFEAIGYKLGHKVAQAKNAFDLMGGDEAESLRAEVRLGRDMEAAFLQRTTLVEENEATRYAGQIAQWLALHVHEKKRPFKLWITAESEPNAMALPGGSIFLSWPLLETCEGNRDEVAFAVGHEMAHIVLRHTLDRIVKDAAVSLLLRRTSGTRAAGAWLSQTGRQLLSRAFSRENELEADAYAVALIKTAGGDIRAAERLLDKLARTAFPHPTGTAGGYFATHPPFRERLANLRTPNRPSAD